MISVVRTEPQSGTILITVRGVIDIVTVGELEQAIDSAIDGRPSHVVVDLGDVGFMGVTALGALLAGNANQVPQCHFAVVVDGNCAVSRPLELANMGEIIELHEELGAALWCCRVDDDLQWGNRSALGTEQIYRSR